MLFRLLQVLAGKPVQFGDLDLHSSLISGCVCRLLLARFDKAEGDFVVFNWIGGLL